MQTDSGLPWSTSGNHDDIGAFLRPSSAKKKTFHFRRGGDMGQIGCHAGGVDNIEQAELGENKVRLCETTWTDERTSEISGFDLRRRAKGWPIPPRIRYEVN